MNVNTGVCDGNLRQHKTAKRLLHLTEGEKNATTYRERERRSGRTKTNDSNSLAAKLRVGWIEAREIAREFLSSLPT